MPPSGCSFFHGVNPNLKKKQEPFNKGANVFIPKVIYENIGVWGPTDASHGKTIHL